MGKKFNFRSRYAKAGLTFFLSGGALVLCYFVLSNFSDVAAFLHDVNSILTPFYLGIIIAYLLCPIYNGSLRLIYRFNSQRMKKSVRAYTLARFSATLIAMLTLLLVVSALIMLVLPELINSIMNLIRNWQQITGDISAWIQNNIERNTQLAELLQIKLENLSERFFAWAQTTLLPQADSIVAGVAAGAIGTIGGLIDVLVALIICIYILNSKEIFQAQAKKLILAMCSKKKADEIFEFGRICNETFGGFITGKIIDSMMVGILCFIGMSILDLPLPVLISVVVGITDIIPFFGPFIGAVPSGILLLCLDPWAAVKFAIMILVIQQIDGNIIAPKILGKHTNLASFWVMFAIIVGGGMFGFVGMILGVPTMAVIYIYIKRLINNRLREKELATRTEIYEDFDKYSINKEDIFGKGSCVPYDGDRENSERK